MSLSKNSIEKIAVFTFGVVFLIVILVLVLIFPVLTQVQLFVFKLILALSAGGVGALLPGFLNIDVRLPLKGGMQAGGALALFASVWFFNPSTIGVEVLPPEEDAEITINHFLKLTDTHDYKSAYGLSSKLLKDRINESTYMKLAKRAREPLGNMVQRELISTATPDEIAGIKRPFVVYFYQAKFSNVSGVWGEVVTVVAEDGDWKLYGYQVGPCELPYCRPMM
ncbi:DUF4019 domain-containing protein [Acinetobacter pittii]|uniref:DUF4019 domain-containing protein n=1 Tax=Acinetobacter pittii TaxID=48296 RepID=UPI0021D241EF|nr:DUF4019 domain-containing protein [Acinetobacter pittii]MCU4561606.1 DUF4019 domain-containing protein [Acinetobacter pittii]